MSGVVTASTEQAESTMYR